MTRVRKGRVCCDGRRDNVSGYRKQVGNDGDETEKNHFSEVGYSWFRVSKKVFSHFTSEWSKIFINALFADESIENFGGVFQIRCLLDFFSHDFDT